jgi:hypothetical protein
VQQAPQHDFNLNPTQMPAKAQAQQQVKPKASVPSGSTKKKQKKEEVYGIRHGSMDRLLRLSNSLVFAKFNDDTSTVRMQGEFKKKVRFITERIIVHLIHEARVRREENNGKRIQSQNIIGAFLAWAKTVNPMFILEFAAIRKLYQKHGTGDDVPAKTKHYLKMCAHAVETSASLSPPPLLEQDDEEPKKTKRSVKDPPVETQQRAETAADVPDDVLA